jgi:LacI family transcriptional regulator
LYRQPFSLLADVQIFIVRVGDNIHKRNATIQEVARRANVSVGTVSNVLNNSDAVSRLLQGRVGQAIRDLNYHPNNHARSLKSRRSSVIGIVISDITNPFFPLVLRGVESAIVQHGYILTIFNTDDNVERERQIFSMLRTHRVDGMLAVVAPNPANDVSHIVQAIDMGIPVVCLDRTPHGLNVDSVVVDNIRGSAMCVRHLVDLGHRKIAIINGSSWLQTARDRYKGYEMALEEANIKIERTFVREGDFRFDSGYKMTKDLLLSHPRPTALFIANGTMGLGALQGLNELAISCPDQVALAIFDEIPGGRMLRPSITSVVQPAYDLGVKAGELLISRLSGKMSPTPVTITLQAELIIGESTTGSGRAAIPGRAKTSFRKSKKK